jgi:hypothetical protein
MSCHGAAKPIGVMDAASEKLANGDGIEIAVSLTN